MPAIGHVTAQPDGSYMGELKTLSIKAPLEIRPNLGGTVGADPDFLVFAAQVEVGFGWKRAGITSGKDYVTLSLAIPEFGAKPVAANLGADAISGAPDTFALIWNPL